MCVNSSASLRTTFVELVRERRFTITELSHFPQISRFLHKMLFRKLCARWTPKQLTPEHKTKRMRSALIFLQQYLDDVDEFLDRIITGDESWLENITQEIKQQ